MTGTIPHYPKIWNLGHDSIEHLFDNEVEITEKVDGSLFGFGVDGDGNIVMRSKGVQLYTVEQNGMFKEAIDQVEKRRDQLLDLSHSVFESPFFVYGEYLRKTKHNVINYSRIPKDNLIIFGARIGYRWVKEYNELKSLANQLEFETVPLLYKGIMTNDRVSKSEFGNPEQTKRFGYTAYEKLKAMIMGTQSVLGNSLIEGVVIKNYNQIVSIGSGDDPCFGKYVREDFKEKLHSEWRPNSGTYTVQEFIDGFKTEARWKKAVQHLKERGELTNSPQDIGKLMKEVHLDIEEEEKQFIMEELYNLFSKDIKRRATGGLPEWYKDQLLKRQCGEL